MYNMYERIEKLCKDNSITVTGMCRELKLSRSSFSDLKAGRIKSISAETLSTIANFFGVSINYLLGKDEEDNIKAFDEHGEPLFLDDEVREIVDSLRTRPEMKILFSASKKATKEDIMKTVKIIETLRNGEDE